jgi:hypothetical protein
MFQLSSNSLPESISKSSEKTDAALPPRLPFFCWERTTKHGTTKVVLGQGWVVLILGLVAFATGNVGAGALLGAGGVTGFIGKLIRGRM